MKKICKTSGAYIADVKAIECRDTFRYFLVGCRSKTKSTVVAVTKCVQFAVRRHHGAVLEATSHLNSGQTDNRYAGLAQW